MPDAAEGRIRLTILGGYLGSGKTTWLRHQLHDGRFSDAHVIVNEAAEIPVDDSLLGGAAGLTVLAGGCVCCDGAPALRATLRSLCDQRSRGADLPEIVLETSGLADPSAVLATIKGDPILVRHIVIARIIVLADALHVIEQLQQDPLGRVQIEAADQIILTKTDHVGKPSLDRLRATLASIAPAAGIGAAAFGAAVTLPPLPQTATALTLAQPETTAPIQPCPIDLGPAPDWTAFAVWLSALLHAHGHNIVRVKGVVTTPVGRLLLQSVRQIVQSPEILPEDPVRSTTDNRVVLIGRGLDAKDLRQSLARFQDG